MSQRGTNLRGHLVIWHMEKLRSRGHGISEPKGGKSCVAKEQHKLVEVLLPGIQRLGVRAPSHPCSPSPFVFNVIHVFKFHFTEGETEVQRLAHGYSGRRGLS